VGITGFIQNRNMVENCVVLLVLILMSWGFSGCAELRKTKISKPVLQEVETLPIKVAVLPFVNKTSDPDAGKVVRKMFYNFFSSLNYLDMEPFQVDEILNDKYLYEKLVAAEPVHLDQLGQYLGVDAVITGEVSKFGKTYAVIYTETSAELKAGLIRCRDEKTLWELQHKVNIGEGDLPLSLTGLATAMVKSVISYKQADRVNAASQLCMQMVETIPNPEKVIESPPRIEVMVHNGAERLLLPGQYLKTVLIGEPGNFAEWEIFSLSEKMSLKEREPGVYVGAYRVKPKDRLSHGRIIGYLKSSQGAGSQWTDILGAVSMGEPTLLPRVISRNTSLSPEKSPYLVSDALLVKQGATLEIEPGTIIWFRNLGMIVRGNIWVRGTPDSPVRFSGLGSSRWKGIFMDQSRGENKFAYCEISNADYGLRTLSSDIFLDHTAFQENGWGIVLDNSEVTMTHCLIRTSEKTGISARDTHLTIANSVISENQGGGILLKDTQAKVGNNNLYNNGEWELKILQGQNRIEASNNWWGPVAEPKIIGDLEIEPMLFAPIHLILFKYGAM
jgi:hypothetical protein